MRRGTTPTHTFEIPFDVSSLKKVKILYTQNRKIIVCKRETELTMKGNSITTELTQEETLKFNPNIPLEIVLRVKTIDDKAFASDPIKDEVCCCYDNEVI